jgi:hypothetical protein
MEWSGCLDMMKLSEKQAREPHRIKFKKFER